ncbi:DUF3764 family protein [Prochlorococcus sp. MIT 1341]|uniref:DUF3764 family protein n=1 Tax=Prochlorococcus sp. MIT 1341 TaxID=3096221 RepID=UPI002A7550B7|nr:DUF3764 family protein [Prochlorococcus sp. MIT 1341]
MNNDAKSPFGFKNLSLWTFCWIAGSTAIDLSFRNANVYTLGIGTLITFIVFAFVLGTSGPFPLWVLLFSTLQSNNKIEATFMVFRISNTFSEWSKIFDEEFEAQKSAGITPIFRGVSKNDPKKVIAVFQAKKGVLEKFRKINNEKIIASGQIPESVEVSIFFPKS